MLWRHRSRDQNGPNFNICSKTLLESFSKNIVKRSCSLINSVLENGHDYFFLKSTAVENLTEKFVSFLLNDHLKILIGLGGERCFFLKRNEWGLGESKAAAHPPIRWDLPSGLLVVRNAGSLKNTFKMAPTGNEVEWTDMWLETARHPSRKWSGTELKKPKMVWDRMLSERR